MTHSEHRSPLRAAARSTQLDSAIAAAPDRFRVLTGDRPTGPLHLGHYFGTLANRGSLASRRNGSSPRHPFPMCSCRSTRLPHGFFESFRWNTLMRSRPTRRSNSRKVFRYPASEQMS